jgi:hypothetical protein
VTRATAFPRGLRPSSEWERNAGVLACAAGGRLAQCHYDLATSPVARLAQPGSKVVRLASAEPKGGSAGFSRTEGRRTIIIARPTADPKRIHLDVYAVITEFGLKG